MRTCWRVTAFGRVFFNDLSAVLLTNRAAEPEFDMFASMSGKCAKNSRTRLLV
jgi:hypothetical protein